MLSFVDGCLDDDDDAKEIPGLQVDEDPVQSQRMIFRKKVENKC